jgi:hypothetical protein
VQLVPDEATDEYVALARRLWQSAHGERVVAVLLQRLLSGDRPQRQPPARRSRQTREGRRAREGQITEQERVESRPDDRRRRRRDSEGERPRRTRRRRERDEGGGRQRRERPSRRGERRERPPRGSGRPGAAADRPAGDGSEPKEFWETWAEEKQDSAGPGDRGRPSTTRLYVNLGKREQITADEVRDLLSEGLGDDAAKIGSVAVRNTHCYVRVPEELVDAIIENTRGKSFKERDVIVERARR